MARPKPFSKSIVRMSHVSQGTPLNMDFLYDADLQRPVQRRRAAAIGALAAGPSAEGAPEITEWVLRWN
jgi:hypothetical protein